MNRMVIAGCKLKSENSPHPSLSEKEYEIYLTNVARILEVFGFKRLVCPLEVESFIAHLLSVRFLQQGRITAPEAARASILIGRNAQFRQDPSPMLTDSGRHQARIECGSGYNRDFDRTRNPADLSGQRRQLRGHARRPAGRQSN